MREVTFTIRMPEENMSNVMERKADFTKLLKQYDELETKPEYALGDLQSIYFLDTVTTASMVGNMSSVEAALQIGYMMGLLDSEKENDSRCQDSNDKEDE